MTWLYWRVFRAPGDPNIPLSMSSPWIIGRTMRILDGYWNTIIQFAMTIDEGKAEALDALALPKDYDDPPIPEDHLRDMIHFVDIVMGILKNPEIKKIEPSEDNPDAFENDIYAGILEATKAIFEESLILHKPYKAVLEYT